MKRSIKTPTIMKTPGQPNFYFSAYPLKVIKESDTEKKYLHIYTRSGHKKKYAEGLKILPMVNPYSQKDEVRLMQNLGKPSHPDNMEERDSDWFASYE